MTLTPTDAQKKLPGNSQNHFSHARRQVGRQAVLLELKSCFRFSYTNVLAFPAKASLQKLKLFVKGEEKFLLLGDRIPGKCIHLSRVHLPRVALRMHFSFRKLSSDRHKQRRTESPRDGGRQAVQKLHCSEHRTVVGVVLVVVVFLVLRQVQGQLTSSQTAKWDCKNYSISSSSPKTKSSELQQSRTVQKVAPS